MVLILIANPFEDKRPRDFSLPMKPFAIEGAVSVVADHSISISRTVLLRQGLSSRPCREVSLGDRETPVLAV
jgi:hypothetical protein